MFQVFKKISKDNKKISKNLLQLSAIFYVANAEFYLPINRLGELWDQTIDKKNINVPLLNAKISESLMKSNLSPPLENFYFIIDFALTVYRTRITRLSHIRDLAVDLASAPRLALASAQG